MKLANETFDPVFYSISSPGSADCGDLGSRDVKDVGYDDTKKVRIGFVPTTEFKNLEITIQNSGEGGVVTLAVVYE